MKLNSISAHAVEDEPGFFVNVCYHLPDATSMMKALSAVAGGFPGQDDIASVAGGAIAFAGARVAAEAAMVTEAPAAEAAPTRRRRAPAEAPTAVADAPADAAPARRRRSSPAVDTSISDADLAKAASNAAVAINKAVGDNSGPASITAILTELGVTAVNLLPQDQRQKFLNEVASEVALAEAEASA